MTNIRYAQPMFLLNFSQSSARKVLARFTTSWPRSYSLSRPDFVLSFLSYSLALLWPIFWLKQNELHFYIWKSSFWNWWFMSNPRDVALWQGQQRPKKRIIFGVLCVKCSLPYLFFSKEPVSVLLAANLLPDYIWLNGNPTHRCRYLGTRYCLMSWGCGLGTISLLMRLW